MFEPVSGETVVQAIINKITQHLVSGELQPGDRLPSEPELAEQMHVSRTALREALKTLVGLGVLYSRRRGGTFVATSVSENILNPLIFSLIIDKGSKDELLELRILLELDAVELVIEKATDEDLRDLSASLDRFDRMVKENESNARLAQEDLTFHLKIMNMTKNSPFNRIGRTIMQLFAVPMSKSLRKIGADEVLANHRKLCQALIDRDYKKARDSIIQSFQSGKEFF